MTNPIFTGGSISNRTHAFGLFQMMALRRNS